MNKKEIAFVSESFVRIKQIDEEIKEINTLARIVASKKTECNLEISIKDVDESKKAKFDEDGSLVDRINKTGGILSFMTWGNSQIEEDKSVKNFHQQISDVILLQIFGVVLASKSQERNSILDKLKRERDEYIKNKKK